MLGMSNNSANKFAAEFARQSAAHGHKLKLPEKPSRRTSRQKSSSSKTKSSTRSISISDDLSSSGSFSTLSASVNWSDSGKQAQVAKEIEKAIEEQRVKISSTDESIERTGSLAKVRFDAGNKVGALLSIKQKKRLEMDKLRAENSLKDLESLLGEVELSDEPVPYKYKMKKIYDLERSEESLNLSEADLLAEITA